MGLITHVEVINDKLSYKIKARIVITFVGTGGVEMVMGQTSGVVGKVLFLFMDTEMLNL